MVHLLCNLLTLVNLYLLMVQNLYLHLTVLHLKCQLMMVLIIMFYKPMVLEILVLELLVVEQVHLMIYLTLHILVVI